MSSSREKVYNLLPKAIDIAERNDLSFLINGKKEVDDASVLCQVSCQERDEESQEHHHEEWQTGDSRCVPGMRDQDVPYRQSLGLEVISALGLCFEMGISPGGTHLVLLEIS